MMSNFGSFRLHPREIARVVVVVEERLGAHAEKVGERFVIARLGGVAQMSRGRLEPLPVLHVIRRGLEVRVDDGALVVDRLLLRRMGLDVRLDLGRASGRAHRERVPGGIGSVPMNGLFSSI